MNKYTVSILLAVLFVVYVLSTQKGFNPDYTPFLHLNGSNQDDCCNQGYIDANGNER